MFRIKYAVTALILVSFAIPAVAATHSAASAKRQVTPAKERRAAACKKQATAQNLHFSARLDFLQTCMRPK